jgi:hypothetical protein
MFCASRKHNLFMSNEVAADAEAYASRRLRLQPEAKSTALGREAR